MAELEQQRVFVVDDERAVRETICETLEGAGLSATSFASASDCLDRLRSQWCDLLITDLKMSGMDGIELLKRARALFSQLPVLVITGYGTVPSAVKAMKSGAVDFVEKPLVKEDFLRQVRRLLERASFADLGDRLTLAERKVLKMILTGISNRQIATLLNRSIRTIETHRARLMEKLGAENLVDLIKVSAAMGLVELPTDPEPNGDGPQ